MTIVITGSTGMIALALINLLKDEHEIDVVRPNSIKIIKKFRNIQNLV